MISESKFGDTDGLVLLLSYLSRLLGWTYFFCWSVSSYPQPIINYRRKSVTGLSIDYFTINPLGHLCFTVSSLSYLYSETIRAQYRKRFPDAGDPTVRFNDFAIAVHAFVLSTVGLSQFYWWGFTRSSIQRLSKTAYYFIIGSVTLIAGVFLLVLTGTGGWEWLDMLNVLTAIKLTIVLIKYYPQVRMNWLLKSTRGWSIHKCFLDFVGGILSLCQLFIDAYLAGRANTDAHGVFNWSAVIRNPLKFWLGWASSGLNGVFILQYFMFRDNDKNRGDLEQRMEGNATGEEEEGESSELIPSSLEESESEANKMKFLERNHDKDKLLGHGREDSEY